MTTELKTFALFYVIASVVVTAILFALDIDGNAGLSIGMLMGCAYAAGGKFVQKNNRLPEKTETKKFAWQAMWFSLLMSVLFIIVFILAFNFWQDLITVLTPFNNAIGWGVGLLIVFVVCLLNYAVVYWGFNMAAKQTFKALSKTNKTKGAYCAFCKSKIKP